MSKVKKMKKKATKQTKQFLSWGAAAAVVVLLAVMPIIAAGKESERNHQASILSGTAAYQAIDTQIIGGGQISSEAAIQLKIPENVKLTQYLVDNGDVVLEGDPIANVDKVSVMTAITEVQDTLDYLSDKIASVSDEEASSYVKALAGGTVKEIYAEEGESVQNVMLDHGALAVLSLDDTMAVQIEGDTDLKPGEAVGVTFSDGTEAEGRVKSNLDGVLTVTVEDDDYSVGAQVTVETEDGDRIGAGELYIFSPWNATAYSGTVDDILVEEGDSVSIGRSLIQLDDPGHTAEYQRLIDQRHEYEELMQELFQMYQTETVTAPCDGIVTGVDKDGAYLLSDDGGNWVASVLSFLGKKEETEFVAYAAKVQSVTDSGMELLMNPTIHYVDSMENLSAVPANISAMTEKWYYTGDTTIYIQNENGLLRGAGTARPGDILLAVGDEETVHWFVMLNGSGNTKQVVQAENDDNSICAFLLSDTDASEVVCTGDDACVADSHNSDCPRNPVQPATCTSSESCEADSHNSDCPRNPVQPAICTSSESCAADSHNSDCPKNSVQTTACTGEESCLASSHSEGCLAATIPDESISMLTTEDNSGTEQEGGNVDPDNDGDSSDPTTPPNTCTRDDACTATNHEEGCPQNNTETEAAAITIVTGSMNQGTVGLPYSSPMQASDGTNVLTGQWAAGGLPAGLVIDKDTGVISGTPTAPGSYTVTVSFTYNENDPITRDFSLVIVEAAPEQEAYQGFVAQVVEIVDGAVKVRQTAYSYTITDLNALPTVTVDTNALTEEITYASPMITSGTAAAGDFLLVILDGEGAYVTAVKQTVTPGTGGIPGTGMPEGGNMPSGGGIPSGGGMPGMAGMVGGTTQTQTFELYSLEELTIASVTSQEHMTVKITVDELDISKISVGQAATITIDALAGETFDAKISQIANNGDNAGGNSKFTVELTLEKSGDMLPGMMASAYITLYTTDNALCVPASAVNEENGQAVLYTSYDADNAVLGDPVAVEIGVADAENVQIVSGLQEGTTFYYSYYDTLEESDMPQPGGFPAGG